MEDTIAHGAALCPVFCTAEIPSPTLDLLLQRSWERLEGAGGMHLGIMTTTEPTRLSKASRPPTQPFSTPYIDQPISAIHDWFVSYIYETWLDGFAHYCFIVLDEYSEETESCIVASFMDGPLEYIRCDFHLALEIALACEMGTMRLSEGTLGMVQESGEILTREMDDLASSGGCYIEAGEVKRDEEWLARRDAYYARKAEERRIFSNEGDADAEDEHESNEGLITNQIPAP